MHVLVVMSVQICVHNYLLKFVGVYVHMHVHVCVCVCECV